MFKKLDQYILKKYLTTFFFCLLLFTLIVVVVDISEKTDDFVKSKLGPWRIFVDYYLGFIPRIDAMLFPLFVFISVIFFTSKMAGRSEVIAILSSGTSFKRYMAPFIVGGTILMSILWLGYQYVVPNANKIWGDFEKKYIDGPNTNPDNNKSSFKQKMYFRIDSNTYASIRYYDTVSKSGSGFVLQKIVNNQLQYNLRSENFSWDTTKQQWKLEYVSERQITGINEKVTYSLMRNASYNFKPRDLRKDEYLKDQLSTPDLNEFIKLEKLRGSESINSLLVERHNRDAIPFSVLILTIIGVSLASRKVRGGSGWHLAIGFVISVLYILCSRLSVVFATKGNFTPLLAAWLPNIIFGLLAFYLYRRAPK
ncbi:MAG: LptF/LptG family permease [Chitinophagaceae bacterium]